MTHGIAHILKTGVAAAAILAHLATGPASAFCGFYVAQADSKLFNKSSKVVLTRDGDQTAITMASDFEGDVKEFAVVVPVPTFIERKQIGVVDPKTIDHLDRYTAPRLVEYHDEDPCNPRLRMASSAMPTAPMPSAVREVVRRNYGVTIEASYDVGEYDVLILSANESDGLVNWLTDNHYRIPNGAQDVLGSYIKQKMRFFVAKVNLDRMKDLGNGYLRPLQVRYQSAKFMLPLRLGTVNASGPQDLIVYRTDEEWPDREHQLSHRKNPVRHRRPALRQGRIRCRFTRRCSSARWRVKTCARCSSSMRGIWAGAIRAPQTR